MSRLIPLWLALLWVSAAPAAESVCAPAWSLSGVAAEADAGEAATFSPEWRPILSRAADCLREPASVRACLSVQGQYDDVRFSDATARALGGERAAGLRRANGRALRVLSELHIMGVSAHRLREVPPGLGPTWRGVSLRFVPDCLPEPIPAWLSSPQAVAAALKREGLFPQPAPAPRPQPSVGASPPELVLMVGAPEGVDPSRLWFELAQTGDGVFGDPQALFGGSTTIGVGVRPPSSYVSARAGLTTAGSDAQSIGLGWALAVGWSAEEWLRIGGAFSHRITSSNLFDPWLEQMWSLGIEAHQRVWSPGGGWHVGLRQHLAPVGQRWIRAEVRNDQIVTVPTTQSFVLRADLGLAIEYDLPGEAW